MIERLFKKAEKVLLIGIGGGGDILGCLPTARYLDFLGVENIIGGLTWERKKVDPKPGPRAMDEIRNIKLLSRTVGLANSKTRVGDMRFTESIVAEHLGVETILVDINEGVRGTCEGLHEAVKKLGVDLIVGIDVGGDCLAKGNEEGIRSPLADSTMLCVLKRMKIATVLGVIGYGSDGELTLEELHRNISEIAGMQGLLGARGIGRGEAEELQEILPKVYSEASYMVLEAAKGGYGEREIREGRRKLQLTPIATITFYFDPKVVYRFSNLAKIVDNSTSIWEADRALRKAGVTTELYFELGMNTD
ncbi:MAG: DUF1152 domain-containing protein [Candidatus Hydrothermarchaeales archaeon]